MPKWKRVYIQSKHGCMEDSETQCLSDEMILVSVKCLFNDLIILEVTSQNAFIRINGPLQDSRILEEFQL